MQKLICLIIILIGFLLISCDLSTDPPAKNIHKGYGTVYGYEYGSQNEIKTGSFDIFHFGDSGDNNKTPESEGFKFGDNVYFEAEIMWSNSNAQGGTTYWCKLLLIRKYN